MATADFGSEEFRQRWLRAGEDAVVSAHEPTASEFATIVRLAGETLNCHRMKGAASAESRIVVMNLLDEKERRRWHDGKTAVLVWGWDDKFGTSLTLTYCLRGGPESAKPAFARAVINKGNPFLETIADAAFKVALVNGKQLVRCDVVDFHAPDWTSDVIKHHLITVNNSQASAYPDAECHYWEVLKCQTTFDEYLSAGDKLSLGWIKRYSKTAQGGRSVLKSISNEQLVEACRKQQLSGPVAELIDVVGASATDSRPVLECLAKCLDGKRQTAWEFMTDLSRLPDDAEGDYPLTAIRVFVEDYLESPRMTGFGRQLPWMTTYGQIGKLVLEPRLFPLHVNPMEYWERLDHAAFRFGWGQLLTGHDVPMSAGELNEAIPKLPRCQNAEECLKQTEFLLTEAHFNKRGTIPKGATVELRIGPFAQLEMSESEGNVFVALRRDDGLVYFFTVEPEKAYFSLELLSPDPGVPDDTTPIVTAALKLLIAAVIRDFWVVEHREVVFTQKRVGKEASRIKREDDRPRIVYLPRVEYSSLQNPDISACAEALHTNERRAHFVSAHLRRSEHPSGSQRVLAARYGIHLPDGYTFVRPHERGGKSREVLYRSRSALRSLYHSDETESVEGQTVEWFKFERDVFTIMEALGFDVEHVAASRRGDSGIDVYATKGTDLDALQWVIQCKCWQLNRKVGPNIVRELVGSLTHHPAGTRGMIVTTSSFTSGAVAEATASNIRLMDGNEFSERLNIVHAS